MIGILLQFQYKVRFQVSTFVISWVGVKDTYHKVEPFEYVLTAKLGPFNMYLPQSWALWICTHHKLDPLNMYLPQVGPFEYVLTTKLSPLNMYLPQVGPVEYVLTTKLGPKDSCWQDLSSSIQVFGPEWSRRASSLTPHLISTTCQQIIIKIFIKMVSSWQGIWLDYHKRDHLTTEWNRPMSHDRTKSADPAVLPQIHWFFQKYSY